MENFYHTCRKLLLWQPTREENSILSTNSEMEEAQKGRKRMQSAGKGEKLLSNCMDKELEAMCALDQGTQEDLHQPVQQYGGERTVSLKHDFP